MLQSSFDALFISASGMDAMQTQLNLIAENMANVNTTHTMEGGPYRRKVAVFKEARPFEEYFLPVALGFSNYEMRIPDDGTGAPIGSGVAVATIARDPAPPKRVYDPTNPEADEHGYVHMPNVDLVSEMTNLIQTSRSYEANEMVIEATKQMLNKALQIITT